MTCLTAQKQQQKNNQNKKQWVDKKIIDKKVD